MLTSFGRDVIWHFQIFIFLTSINAFYYEHVSSLKWAMKSILAFLRVDETWTAVRATEPSILIALATWRYFHWPSALFIASVLDADGNGCPVLQNPCVSLLFGQATYLNPLNTPSERKEFSAILIWVKLVKYFTRWRKGILWCSWLTQANFKSSLQWRCLSFFSEKVAI